MSRIFRCLSYALWSVGLHSEGIERANVAHNIYLKHIRDPSMDLRVGDTLNKIGLLYHDSLKFHTAERYLNEALVIFNKVYESGKEGSKEIRIL